MRRVLLTGGTGFAGSRFVQLYGDSYEFILLGRKETTGTADAGAFFKVDLTDIDQLQDVAARVGDVDAVVHLAAHVPNHAGQDNLRDAVDANVVATANLLEVFGSENRRFVLGSTVEVYDQTQIYGQISSGSKTGPRSFYAATKLASEEITAAYALQSGMPLVILRFTVMYGPNDPISRALPNFVKAAIRGETITVGGYRNLRDWIHVDDVALSLRCALESSYRGTVNIGTGHGVSIQQAAEAIIEQSGSSSSIEIGGASGVDIVLNAAEALDSIGFQADWIFPDGLEQMIASFRSND